MEEFVKLKEVASVAKAALLMNASEKAAVEEEKAPKEWMADDVSSSECLNHVWICLVY